MLIVWSKNSLKTHDKNWEKFWILSWHEMIHIENDRLVPMFIPPLVPFKFLMVFIFIRRFFYIELLVHQKANNLIRTYLPVTFTSPSLLSC